MNVAYNMDCLEAMRQMPDKCFDLAVVDPPYFSGPEKRMYYGATVSAHGVQRVNYPITDKWQIPEAEYFRELERVSNRYIVWGCNYFDWTFAPGRIVWDKCNTGATFSDCELAATNCHDSTRLFRFMWNGMLQGKNSVEGYIQQGDKSKNEVRIHPTQKPVALYEWIFNRYTKPGDMILDTHLGSGSSRIAAWNAGLHFVGFEIEPVYFTAQEKRFADYTAQENLFVLGGAACEHRPD